jgi:hypothetical protein
LLKTLETIAISKEKDKEDMDFKMSFTESIIKLNIQKADNILKKYSFW